MSASWSEIRDDDRPMPAATIVLTSEPGYRLVAHGVDLESFDEIRDDLVKHAESQGWRGPHRVAPAPGEPAGVIVHPMCHGCGRREATATLGRLCVPCDDVARESEGASIR